MELALRTAERLPLGPVAGFLLLSVLALAPSRGWLEASLIGHMLIQIPLLAAAGWIVARGLRGSPLAVSAFAAGLVPSLALIALFTTAFWMLPRYLDAALTEPSIEIAKFVTLPLLVGLPLGLVWQRLGTVVRGFIWGNSISMLAVPGWLYVAAPMRICNNYLADQQTDFGWAAWGLATAIAVYWTVRAFVGDWPDGARELGPS